MPIPCFSSAEELRLIFDHIILIIFAGPGMESYRINTVHKKKIFKGQGRFLFEIVIGTALGNFKHADGKVVTDLEEEQKAILVHELLHVFHFCVHGQGFGLWQDAFGFSWKDYELEIDKQSYRIVRTDHLLFREIVRKLTIATHCSFRYEINATPFLSFHKILVSDLLSQVAKRPIFGDREQIQILRTARHLGICSK